MARRTPCSTSATTRPSSSTRSSRRWSASSAGARFATSARCSPATFPRRSLRSIACGRRPVSRRIRHSPRVSPRSSRGIATTTRLEAVGADAKLARATQPLALLQVRMILVTGGAGFIGANFVLDWLARDGEPVVNVDKLTYAGNLRSLIPLAGDGRHVFVRGDIGDADLVRSLLERHRPRAIVNFAAETHVDRSIHGPAAFIQTNVVGTFALLDCVRAWWIEQPETARGAFRFLHVSTDEVYGSLDADAAPFTEATPFAPNSPYAASKASSDHLVRAYAHTYGLPTLTTHCSNNYGPLQFPEKLVPLMIVNALAGAALPVYGDGRNVRDWLYVGDHCSALGTVLARGRPGESYNVGGDAEMRNLDVVHT